MKNRFNIKNKKKLNNNLILDHFMYYFIFYFIYFKLYFQLIINLIY